MPAKTIKASTLAAAGRGGGGPADRHVRGAGRLPRDPCRARRTSPRSTGTRTSKRLIVHTKPGLGDLQQAEFRGNVKFVDGAKIDRRSADRLVSGRPGSPRPHALDDRPGPAADRHRRPADRPRANDLDGGVDAEAEGRDGRPKRHGPASRDAGRGAPGQAAQDATEQTKLPSLLKQDQPVTIRSNRLEYDGAASHAIYSGSARLTQPGGTELQADTIDLDDKSGNLIAHIKVRTKMLLDDVDSKTNAANVDRHHRHGRAFRLRGRQASRHLHVDGAQPRASRRRARAT